MPQADRTLAAAGLILIYALSIGFTDNFVRVIAEDGGLWQFHLLRSVMAIGLLVIAAPMLKLNLRPQRPGAVAARSAVHGFAMLVYFGSLAFFPVAVVAAGLFTAPIFVLLISRFAYGHRIGPWRILAVALGFLGVILVLGPAAVSGASVAALMPIAAGLLYAIGNIATREWCEGERPEVLLAGFFVALGLLGMVGLAVFALLDPVEAEGPAAFVLRGWAMPTGRFLFWTFVQAAGSLIAVGMMIRAYQIAEASRVSVFEYVILPCSALWGWLLWSEVLSLRALTGMALIIAAGLVIALRAVQPAADQSPTASRQ